MQLEPVLVQLEQQLDVNQTLPLEQLNMTQLFIKQGYLPMTDAFIRSTAYSVYEELVISENEYALPQVLSSGLDRSQLASATHYEVAKAMGVHQATDLDEEHLVLNSDPAFKILPNCQPISGSIYSVPSAGKRLNLVTELIWDNASGNNALNYGFVLALTVVGEENKLIYYLDRNNQWREINLEDPYNTQNAIELRQSAKLHLMYYGIVRPLGNYSNVALQTLSNETSVISVLTGQIDVPEIANNIFNQFGNVNLNGKKTVLSMIPFVLSSAVEVPLIMNRQNSIDLDYETYKAKLYFTVPALNYGVISEPRQSHLYMAQRLSPENTSQFTYGQVLLFQVENQQVGLFMMGMLE